MSILEKIKQYGIRMSVLRLFKKCIRTFGITYESYIYLVNNLNREFIFDKIKLYDYSDVVELSYSDFLDGDKRVFNEVKLELIKSRLSSSDYSCFGIKKNGLLIYSTWISTKEIVINSNSKYRIALNQNQALLEDSYCHPDFRGSGLHSKMNLFRIAKILETGRDQVIAIVVKENVPALKTQLKSGFKVHSSIRLIRIFNQEFVFEKLHETD